jgi:hypothetical protein
MLYAFRLIKSKAKNRARIDDNEKDEGRRGRGKTSD